MEMLTDLEAKSAAASACAGASLQSGLLCDLDESEEDGVAFRRASAIGSDLLDFVQAKEDFRQQLNLPSWLWWVSPPLDWFEHRHLGAVQF